MLAACSSGGSTEPVPGAALPTAEDETTPKKEPGDRSEVAKGAGRQKSRPGGERSPGSSQTERKQEEVAGAGKEQTGLALPEPGRYVYSQKGWEEFCQTGSCDKKNLPTTQDIRLSLQSRSKDRAVLVSEAEASGSRSQTVTYLVQSQRVLITDIQSSYAYRSVSFESHLEPDPAILSARLPLKVGDSWSGRWKDRRGEMDGSYEMRVARREPVSAGNRDVNAFVIEVGMTFSGDYKGTSDLTIWAAPGDLTIVGTKGRMELSSSFGTYRTRFTNYYRSGP